MHTFVTYPKVTFQNNRFRRSEEHTSELQSRGHLVCRLLLEKKKTTKKTQKGMNGNNSHEKFQETIPTYKKKKPKKKKRKAKIRILVSYQEEKDFENLNEAMR